ncbi:unnamed protein product [Closterium sp. Naga37s-1]|nr:unnamed protein product [Closterium sp. Naga37s-1]
MATAEESDVAMAHALATATNDISDRTEIVAAHVAGDKQVAEAAQAVGDSVASAVHPAEFDKEQFDTVILLQALAVPARLAQQTSRIVYGHTFDRPRLRHILPHPSDSSLRLVLLDDVIKEASTDLPPSVRQQLQQEGLFHVTTYEQRLDYSYWPADHVLRKLLPPGVEVPTAFETVGHIAHVNLRDDLLPYRFVIGKVLLEGVGAVRPRPKTHGWICMCLAHEFLDYTCHASPSMPMPHPLLPLASQPRMLPHSWQKNTPLIRTVVNKSGIIENEFRVPTLELIAGEGSSSHLETSVRQHGATFHLDYARVYWNSRLEHEHKRLVDAFFKRGDVVVDMFAGVGPFAVPAAKAGCAVLANDLNPASVEYLRRNVRVNGVEGRVKAYNEDARVFVRGVLKLPEQEGAEMVARGVEGFLDDGKAGEKVGDGEAGGKGQLQQEEGENGEREQQRAAARGVKRERGEQGEGEGMEVEGVEGEQRVALGSASAGQWEAEAGREAAEGVTGSAEGQVAREVGEKDGEGREVAGGDGGCATAGSRDGSEEGVGRGAGEGMQGANTQEGKAEGVAGGKQEEQKGGRTGRKGKGKKKGGKGESKDGEGIDVASVAPWRHVDHVVMNLPASAITFLGTSVSVWVRLGSTIAFPSHARLAVCGEQWHLIERPSFQTDPLPTPLPHVTPPRCPPPHPANHSLFSDSFRGAFSRAHWEGPLPLVHTYCFHRSGHTAEAVMQVGGRRQP